MKLDSSDLKKWKEDPITIKLFEILKDQDELIRTELLHPMLCFSDNPERRIAFNGGVRVTINRVLNIALEDLQDEEEEENVNEAEPEALR